LAAQEKEWLCAGILLAVQGDPALADCASLSEVLDRMLPSDGSLVDPNHRYSARANGTAAIRSALPGLSPETEEDVRRCVYSVAGDLVNEVIIDGLPEALKERLCAFAGLDPEPWLDATVPGWEQREDFKRFWAEYPGSPYVLAVYDWGLRVWLALNVPGYRVQVERFFEAIFAALRQGAAQAGPDSARTWSRWRDEWTSLRDGRYYYTNEGIDPVMRGAVAMAFREGPAAFDQWVRFQNVLDTLKALARAQLDASNPEGDAA
jgi:hypothetical protein